MTLTLEMPNDFAAQIEHAARLRGTDTPGFVLEATRRALESDTLNTNGQTAQERRNAAIDAGFGMFAGALPSVDEFLAQRRAEAQAEAHKDGL